ncbi:MAG: redoxin domain-containing protein [Chitinophagaceae bacterium]|nr:redoxin domain-containing protein [Chitinophagaceae bacterium]
MKKLRTSVLAVLWPVLNFFAQTNSANIRFLSIGDRVPDFPSVQWANASNASLSIGKDAVLILNFMSADCMSCIRSLPKMDSIQKKLGKAVQIVLITSDKRTRFESFLANTRIGRSINFPVIVEDSLLKALFPHEFISHEVWIKNNKVIAITGSEYVTFDNVKRAYSDPTFSLPLKHDRPDYDYSQSLISAPSNAIASSIYSVLLSHLTGVPRRYMEGVDSTAGIRWYRMINLSIVEMFSKLWRLPLHLSPDRLQLRDVKDSSRLVYDKESSYRNQWKLENTYCYEARFPLCYSEQECLQKIRSDLACWLNFESIISGEKKPSLIIRQIKPAAFIEN